MKEDIKEIKNMGVKILNVEQDAMPGAVIAMQSFGDFLGFNPHRHVLITDGCFYEKSMFGVAPPFDNNYLEEIFRQKVFKMLLCRRKITQDLINILIS